MPDNILKKDSAPKAIIRKGTDAFKKYPFYIKAPMVLIGIYMLFNILLLLQDILVPICFAGLIAILLNPVVNKLQQWHVPKILAIFIVLLVSILIVGGIIAFISSQLADFSELAPELKKRSAEMFAKFQQWLQSTFNISKKKQLNMYNSAIQSGQAYIGQTLSTVAGIISVAVLLPIYTFLILYYKPLFLNFFFEVFESKHEEKVSEVLNETKSAVQSYIFGLLVEMLIVAALNSAALLLLGVKYAILLGIIGAILNVIPYIGGIIAIALPVLMALITGDGNLTTPLLVVAAYTVIQFIDNNIIVPRVVSSKVEVNAFVSIVIVLLGGAFWGVSGMFLSIPFVAICKIIFDRIEELQPWGKLLGTKMDKNFTIQHMINASAENEEHPEAKNMGEE